MGSIGQYLVGITAAALICGVLTSLVGKNQPHGSLIRMICGIFLTLCVIAPVKDIRFTDIGNYLDSLQLEGQRHVSIGEDSYSDELREIIKSNTEAYILDKAGFMGLSITVEVEVSYDDPPLPIGVVVTGNVSSYNKQRLTDVITNDLGIPEDGQIWK